MILFNSNNGRSHTPFDFIHIAAVSDWLHVEGKDTMHRN